MERGSGWRIVMDNVNKKARCVTEKSKECYVENYKKNYRSKYMKCKENNVYCYMLYSKKIG